MADPVKMSIIKLIGLGLWVSPFVFMPSGTRGPKEIFVLSICIALGLLAIYRGEIKRFRNTWILFLIGWFVINLIMAPRFDVMLLGTDASNFWIWKPFIFCVAYFLAILAISSANITSKDWAKLLKMFIYPALIMSIYVIFQWFGYDQIFGVKEVAIIGRVTNPHIAGTMGQPTIVAPFIAMCVPFAIYGRKYVITLIMIVAVIMTKSMVAIGALSLAIIILLSFLRMRKMGFIGVIILGLMLGCMMVPQTRNIIINKVIGESSGRFKEWPRIIKDNNSPVLGGKKTYPFTGFGAGSFKYVYASRMMKGSTPWKQAHNEYIEILYNFGIFGLFLFLASIFYFVKRAIPKALAFGGDRIIAILCSLLCISICAGGTFVWQIGTTAFYTVVLVGFLHNTDFLKGDNNG